MDMKHCLLRRLLGLVPLLLGISFLSFVLIQLSPGTRRKWSSGSMT